jgi:hypothetical protein
MNAPDAFVVIKSRVHKAFAALTPEKATALESDMVDLLSSMNRRPGSLVVPSEYLQVVVTRR